jgi:hypothetical protein
MSNVHHEGEHPATAPVVEVFIVNMGGPSGSAGSGGGSGGTTPPTPPAGGPSSYGYPPQRFTRFGGGFVWPLWIEDALGVLAVLAAIALVVIGLIKLADWVFGNHSPTPKVAVYDRKVTVADFIRNRHFRLVNHTVCAAEKATNGTQYRISLNRGQRCHQTAVVTVNNDQVTPLISKNASATIVTHGRVLFQDMLTDSLLDEDSPSSGKKAEWVAWAGRHTIAQLVEFDVQRIILRLPPKMYAQLK